MPKKKKNQKIEKIPLAKRHTQNKTVRLTECSVASLSIGYK
jgi:hypothetical protein